MKPLLPILTLCLALTACGTAQEDEAKAPRPERPKAAEAGLVLIPVGYDALPGWSADDLDGAFQALNRSCARLLATAPDATVGTQALVSTAADWQPACQVVTGLGEAPEPAALRVALEAHYTPFLATDVAETDPDAAQTGLFTGYFEVDLNGARERSEAFATPLYARPDDLITVDLGTFDLALKGKGIVGMVNGGRLVPYPTRSAIEAGALAGRGLELLWIDDPMDVFLLQVQGSGRVALPDGGVVRVGFAADNGRGYRSIGRKLIDDGELEPHQANWDGIHRWIEDNPERAAALFAYNPRFIFFRLLEGDGPVGAEGVVLTPERSLAVDTRYIPLGMPLWLDTTHPGTDGTPLRRLMVAQDRGSGIRGVVRGDFFWGHGDAALKEAGRMKSRGRYFLLLPNPLAERVRASL